MKIENDIGQLQAKIREFGKGIEVEANELTKENAKELLTNIIDRNPVDTGRSRAAWVESLEKLGGAPPPGWQGATAEKAAIEEGRKLSKLEIKEKSVSFSSAVEYIQTLEYGTTQRAAFQMVRNSIRWMAARIRRRRKNQQKK